jgi:hypothetical protein
MARRRRRNGLRADRRARDRNSSTTQLLGDCRFQSVPTSEERVHLRKTRLLIVTAIAVLGITAVAFAQANQYTISGSMSAGGSKAKPLPVGLKFDFQTTAADPTLLPQPIKTYSIGFEGASVDTSIIPVCKASKMSAAQSDKSCPSKAVFGSGIVKAKAGSAGGPIADAADCELGLTLYNSGNGHGALWLEGGPGTAHTCIAGIHEAIDATFKKSATGTALVFTVPDKLRHVAGLDVAVVSTTSTIKKISAKKKNGKKVGYFNSVGCPDKQRDLTVTFTDESGAAVPVKKTIGKC